MSRRDSRFYLMALVFLVCSVLPNDRSLAMPAQQREFATHIRHEQARKFDEYGNIRFDDEKARLDNFATELHFDPTSQGYILAYGMCAGDAMGRVNRVKDYLVNSRGIDAARLVMVDGGCMPELNVQLWVVPRGSTPPRASTENLVSPCPECRRRARSRAGSTTSTTVPVFPWPPPRASASASLAPSLLQNPTGTTLLQDVATRLEKAFNQAGYGEMSWYSIDSEDKTASLSKIVKNFEVCVMPSKPVQRAYRVVAVPLVMLVSSEGNVEWVHYGALSDDKTKEISSVIGLD